MGTEPVRPLQLVDSERFNRLIDTLQQTLGRREIVEQATASPHEQAYVKSYYDAVKSVKSVANMEIVNFLNKKDRFKGSLAAKAHLPQPPDDDGPPNAIAAGSPREKRAGVCP
jgi:hypothetical protein